MQEEQLGEEVNKKGVEHLQEKMRRGKEYQSKESREIC